MLLAIDANILFALFNPKSFTRRFIILNRDILELYSPKFAIEEIEKYKQVILEKFNLTEENFEIILSFIRSIIYFVDLEFYKERLIEAKRISPDIKDVEYFALALKLNCPIWSNDKVLKNQKTVKVLSTNELIEILGKD
jgi:predicted nucleic acid-binding protein